MKTCFKILTLSILSTIIIPFTAIAQPEPELFNLEIQTQEECESLDGTWNECPPNECQRTVEYQSGEVDCPAVCGQPICEGIVPKDDEDLSEDHNPFIDQTIGDNSNQQDDTDEIQKKPTINERQLTVYVIIGLILILIFIVLKFKNKIQDEQNEQG